MADHLLAIEKKVNVAVSSLFLASHPACICVKKRLISQAGF
jgi:hypothetical protein